jgi:hypothetical protein
MPRLSAAIFALLGDQLVADLCTFRQTRVAGSLDGGNMHEHIGSAIIGRYESAPFVRVEPLHRPLPQQVSLFLFTGE